MEAPLLLLPPERFADLKARGRLPSPKGVAAAIVRLLERDDFPVEQLVHLVQSDPAIAGRLLKVANAAAWGRPRPLVALRQAILALGALRVRDLVVGFSLLRHHQAGQCRTFDYAGFWSRSLATAIACQELAPRAQVPDEEIFTLGLLARVGELGLATLFPDAYGALLAGRPAPRALLVLENERFGFDHRALTASMLADWGLPELLLRAAYHHEFPDDSGLPEGSRQDTLCRTLDFARALAEVCVAPDEDRWGLLPDLVNRSARLGVDPGALGERVDAIAARWKDWGSVLQVRTRDLPPFADLLAASPPRGGAEDVAAAGTPALLLAAAGPEAAAWSALLADEGLCATLQTDPARTLATVCAAPPPLVLVDLDCPGLDGVAFCEHLRQCPRGNEPYVLALSARPWGSSALGAVEAGADDVLDKAGRGEGLRLRLAIARRLMALRGEMRRERQDLVRSAGEFADSHRRLIQVALTDPLTQLPNRRHGLDFLGSEWEAAQAAGQSIALLMLDIDHFKTVNDTWGHAAGDAVLRRLAVLLAAGSRAGDLVFRYGGEEFAVVLPATGLDTAREVAERIRLAVEQATFEWEDWIIPVTVSVGVSVTTPALADASALVAAADGALYQAKASGRNRVVAAR
jgi:diguanylate cyclase (GGDEF)-like protein